MEVAYVAVSRENSTTGCFMALTVSSFLLLGQSCFRTGAKLA